MRRSLLGCTLLALFAGGCDVQGDWNGVGWAPVRTMFAVADRHELVDVGGSLVASRRADAAQTLSIVLTAAGANPQEEWRRSEAARLTELRTGLAGRDGVYLHRVPLVRLVERGEFFVSFDIEDTNALHGVVVDHNTAPDQAGLALGRRLFIRLLIDDIDPRAGGWLSGEMQVSRGRDDDQEAAVAEGTVTVPLQIPVVAERLGKANLGIALPILRCAAERGPHKSGTCASIPAAPVPDAADPVGGL